MRHAAPALFAVLALAALATAGVTVQLRSGNSATGTLDSVEQVEVFTIGVPAGAVLAVKAKGKRGGREVGVRVRDDLGELVGGDLLRPRGTGVRGSVPLMRGGTYTIEVFSRTFDEPGGYSLRVRWKSPRTYDVAPPSEVTGGTVSFRADAGARVTGVVSAVRGSDVLPRITSITGPNEFEATFGLPAKRAGDRVKKVTVPFTGDYTLHYADDGGTGGAIRAKVSVKQPRPTKSRFDISELADDAGVEDGRAAVGFVALAGVETTFVVQQPVSESDPLTEIVGASVVVAAGSLSKPAVIVIATSDALVPPVGSEDFAFEALGPPVFFGPDGKVFEVPVEIELPAAVTAGEDDIAVLTQSGGETSVITAGIEVLAGFVRLPVSHFSSFQVFRVFRPSINGDENLDAVFTAELDPNRLCLGDGVGGFNSCSNIEPADHDGFGVALGDVNGDGNLDAVFANSGVANRVCLGDGAGGFTSSDVEPSSDSSFGVALGDLNGDGNLDAVFANANQRNRVCLGDGAGGFGPSSDVSTDTNLSFGVALGDLNGDGNLDAIFANGFSQRNRICLGDGAGGFTCSDVSTDSNSSFGVTLGDLNGDGKLDAVFANRDQPNRVCLGDGVGGFTCSNISTDTNDSSGVALGDVNGDGNLDVVFANRNGNVGEPNRVCLGDGAGGFSCSDVSADAKLSTGVALGDVNGDGNLDAVFSSACQANRVCLGDGAGGFSCSDILANEICSNGVALEPLGPARAALPSPPGPE